jgi:hypothetical protein
MPPLSVLNRVKQPDIARARLDALEGVGRGFRGTATPNQCACIALRCLLVIWALVSSDAPGAPVLATTDPLHKYSIRWTSDPADTNRFAVEVSGLEANALQTLRASNWDVKQWQRLLSAYVEQEDLFAEVGLPPMLGVYRVEAGVLRFQPQFPQEPGLTYRAIFRPAHLPGKQRNKADLIAATFQVPSRSSSSTTTVRQIYPSADVLPENLLKFYVHFSAPMSRGHIYDHIHLRDDSGKEVELPFLEIDEELWDPAMTRLTLFIDPGRIKRGVRPLEDVGPALQEGRRYTLLIDSAWRDGWGNPLKEEFQKEFKVGPSDREPPDPGLWKVQSPQPETRQPLTITFSEPMDQALAQRVIRVGRESGEPVEGRAELADQERRWTFTPLAPWRRGAYRLLVQKTIEDLAGNNIGKPFEVDLFDGIQRRLNTATVNLPFEVR